MIHPALKTETRILLLAAVIPAAASNAGEAPAERIDAYLDAH